MYSIDNYKDLDWTKTDKLLARETSLPYHVVRRFRKQLNKPKARWKWSQDAKTKASHVKIKDWSGVNWDLQDIVISKQLGICRERVRQVRRALGKPNPVNYHKRSTETVTGRLQREAESFRGMSAAEVAKIVKCSISTVLSAKIPIRDGREVHPWHLMNFDLGNRDLSRIWNAHNTVLSRHRKKNGHKIKFDVRYGRKDFDLNEYHKAITQEQRKATEFFNGKPSLSTVL